MVENKLLCSVNLKDCTSEALYVCHHCGRPLCDSPQCRKWILDATFVGWPSASHCPECDHLFSGLKIFRYIIDWLNQKRKSIQTVIG